MEKIIVSIVLVISFLSAGTVAQDSTQIAKWDKISTEYFSAFGDMDFKKMSSFFHEDGVYIDETYLDKEGKTAMMEGPNGIYSFYKSTFEKSGKKFIFEEKERFFSGKQGVFKGTVKGQYWGSAAGRDDSVTLQTEVEYIMVLTFEGDKIIRQNDYIDYKTLKYEWLEE